VGYGEGDVPPSQWGGACPSPKLKKIYIIEK